MIENVIAQRYARALIGIAAEQNAIDEYGKQLHTFAGFCKENRDLLKSLSDRYNDLFARERIVAEIADKAGFAEPVKNFLKLLVHKGRIALFHFVAEEYDVLAHEKMGRVVMKVVSAKELSDSVYDDLLQTFKQRLNKETVLKKQILPDVIGGLRVHIGDRVFDYTVRSQIDRVKQAMLA